MKLFSFSGAVYLGPHQRTWRNSQELRRPDSTDIPDATDAGVAAVTAPGTTGDDRTASTAASGSAATESPTVLVGDGDRRSGQLGGGGMTSAPTGGGPVRHQFVVTSPALLAVPGRGTAVVPVSHRLQKILVNAQEQGDGIGDPQL